MDEKNNLISKYGLQSISITLSLIDNKNNNLIIQIGFSTQYFFDDVFDLFQGFESRINVCFKKSVLKVLLVVEIWNWNN